MKENIIIEISQDELVYLIDAITTSNLPIKRSLIRILNILKSKKE